MKLTQRDLRHAWHKVANILEEQAMESLFSKRDRLAKIVKQLETDIGNTKTASDAGIRGATEYMQMLQHKLRRYEAQLVALEYQLGYFQSDPNQTDAFKTDKPKK